MESDKSNYHTKNKEAIFKMSLLNDKIFDKDEKIE